MDSICEQGMDSLEQKVRLAELKARLADERATRNQAMLTQKMREVNDLQNTLNSQTKVSCNFKPISVTMLIVWFSFVQDSDLLLCIATGALPDLDSSCLSIKYTVVVIREGWILRPPCGNHTGPNTDSQVMFSCSERA